MDRTASAGFEGIAQMLLEQKKLMDALEAENRELRRQLADLRRGIGIAVVIEGKTVQLATEAASASAANGQTQLQALQTLQPTPANGSPVNGNGYNQNGRQQPTGAQPTVNMNGEKRESGTARSPLADSFVL